MNILASISTEDREDALKYAYAFMKSKKLNIKECSFFNPLPAITYCESVPDWEQFASKPAHLTAIGFSCVASLDTKDKMRVNLSLLNNVIIYTCYGNYENKAKAALTELIEFHKNL